MSQPRPKFCVGEEVMTRGWRSNEFDTDRTEIIARFFTSHERVNLEDSNYVGWVYQTSNQLDMTHAWRETSLRKIPPNPENSFESLMEKINPCTLIKVKS